MLLKRLILFFLLFVLPFIVFPFGTSYFEIPKVIAAEIAIEILLFYFLLTTRKPFSFISYTLKNAALLVIFLLTIIHLLFFQTDTTFFGNIFRLQGVLLLWHLMIFALLAVQLRNIHIPLPFFGITFFLLFLFTVIGITNGSARAVGTLGEPHALSAVMLFLWPFVFLTPIKNKILEFSYKLVSIFCMVSILLLTGSRSASIGFFIEFLLLGLVLFFRFRLGYSLVLCLLVLTGSLLFPFMEIKSVYENRASVWQTALFAGLQQPFIGHGFGNTEKALKNAAVTLKSDTAYQYVDSSHNVFLDFWVQGGIVGLGAFIFLVASTIRQYVKEKDARKLAVFLGILSVMSFNPVSIVNLIAFWWLVGEN